MKITAFHTFNYVFKIFIHQSLQNSLKFTFYWNSFELFAIVVERNHGVPVLEGPPDPDRRGNQGFLLEVGQRLEDRQIGDAGVKVTGGGVLGDHGQDLSGNRVPCEWWGGLNRYLTRPGGLTRTARSGGLPET